MASVKPDIEFYDMYNGGLQSTYGGDISVSFWEDALLVMKGKAVEYKENLPLVRSLDLSDKFLSGHIPIEITCLRSLLSLNLSYNRFTGEIPEKIGDMEALESIDFSMNSSREKFLQACPL